MPSDQLFPAVPTFHHPLLVRPLVADQGACIPIHHLSKLLLPLLSPLQLQYKKHTMSTNTESPISRSLHCGNELPNDLYTQRSGCELMRLDYNLPGTTGCVRWFLPCLFWQWHCDCRKSAFLFKILPKGGRKLMSDKQMRRLDTATITEK